jgi:hypothetical protein
MAASQNAAGKVPIFPVPLGFKQLARGLHAAA